MSKIKFSKKEIREFQRRGIETIYLFGSVAQTRTQPMSDIDIGVVFSQAPERIKDRLTMYKKLYKLFSKFFPIDKEIDVVFLQFTPLDVQISAIQTGQILYQRNKAKRYIYEEHILKQYLDFQPHLQRFNRAILSRI